MTADDWPERPASITDRTPRYEVCLGSPFLLSLLDEEEATDA